MPNFVIIGQSVAKILRVSITLQNLVMIDAVVFISRLRIDVHDNNDNDDKDNDNA